MYIYSVSHRFSKLLFTISKTSSSLKFTSFVIHKLQESINEKTRRNSVSLRFFLIDRRVKISPSCVIETLFRLWMTCMKSNTNSISRHRHSTGENGKRTSGEFPSQFRALFVGGGFCTSNVFSDRKSTHTRRESALGRTDFKEAMKQLQPPRRNGLT